MADRTLAYFPLPLLAVPMGLGGMGLAWRVFAEAAPWAAPVGEALMALTALAWIVITALHVMRAMRHPFMAREDWQHPFRGSFAGAIAIGLMLVAATLLPYVPGVARVVLLVAVALQWGVGLALLGRALRGEGSGAMLAPPLLIPLVGNLVASIFAPALGMPMLGWMLFGVGTTLWLALQPLLLHRMVEGPPLPVVLRPAFFILLAPPAVSALALEALGGHGPLVFALYGFACFTLALLVIELPFLVAGGFNPGFWAFTFPLAAFASITMRLADFGIGAAALAVCSLAIGWIAWRTLRASPTFFHAP
ncbi:hypothetical protein [Roseococcus sp. YIM B11640]|uniref:SLAC1 family transporter n=1 Tax=Roseococcus sp. YIM B11640 TaxID=3133973 RepID=UPI003C79B1DA